MEADTLTAPTPSGPYAPPAPDPRTEPAIATDIARRALMAAPVVVGVAAVARGADGAASAGFALGLVVVNFLLSAASLAWAARISHGLYMGTALGGYLVRLGLITVAVLLVRDLSWVDLPTLGITLIVSHLGLLVWELRAVSLTLAAPGLRPPRPTSGRPDPSKTDRAREGVAT